MPAHQPDKHIRPIFSKYFGNPLASCTDDHAHQCRLMLGIEDTLLGMRARLRRRRRIPPARD
jgi:hypothetical protein